MKNELALYGHQGLVCQCGLGAAHHCHCFTLQWDIARWFECWGAEVKAKRRFLGGMVLVPDGDENYGDGQRGGLKVQEIVQFNQVWPYCHFNYRINCICGIFNHAACQNEQQKIVSCPSLFWCLCQPKIIKIIIDQKTKKTYSLDYMVDYFRVLRWGIRK